MAADTPLWSPSEARIAEAPLTEFTRAAERASGQNFASYRDLHAWSVAEREAFWDLVWDFCGITGDKGETVLADGDRMPGAHFFPDARLNFAENLLKKSGSSNAIVFRGEDQVERRLSWDELHARVSQLQQLFVKLGVRQGDRVAAMMPNMPETVAAMLAATSIGAVWSSCSPDFGEQGVLDRFGQIEPVVFIVPDGYWYAGKAIEVADKVATVVSKLKSLRKVLVVDYLARPRTSPPRSRARKRWRWRCSPSRPKPSRSSDCLSRIRSISCSPPARPEFRNASCIRPAAP
ncbi:AMP-binding protein [Mesorhizobium amorphae]|uniref:AMP-binding protein n=1 Tax=Mesorhizobium amorphae TaxID=71433 RepID=UPI0021B3F6B3|nr:AMP-binding protein [Mesorhizobium amorphae]